jgi:ferritin-like metal-binding protein YciE
LCALAKKLGYTEAMTLLNQTLEEEKATDKKLTILAEQEVSAETAGANV